MPKTDERIEALQKSLEESRKLYEDTKLQYDAALASFEQAKASVTQATSFLNTLNSSQFNTADALKAAASFAPNPQDFATNINQPGIDTEKIKQKFLDEGKKIARVAELAKDKAEREVQRVSKAVEGINNQISVILNQLGIAVSGITLDFQAKKEKKINDAKVKQRSIKIKINEVRAILKKNKAAIKAVAKSAALFVISKLLNKGVQRLAKTVQQLSELVDKVNDQIESIQTKQDVLKARVTRDAALRELKKAELQITNIRDVIKTLEILLTILSLVVKILISTVQIPTTPLTVGRIVNAVLTLDSITIMLGVTKSALDDLIAEVQYQKSRLLPISDIIDQALDQNLTPEEIFNLLDNRGNIEIAPYKGFIFKIYDENDPNFVVAGNKRKYAVALDRSGFIRLRSQASFTLDPDILIEELKLQIDEQNLEA